MEEALERRGEAKPGSRSVALPVASTYAGIVQATKGGGEEMTLGSAPAVTVLTASDVQRAKTFYTEKLGLKVAPINDPTGGVYLEAGDETNIYVYNSGAPKATNTVASFKVGNVLSVVNELKQKGVRFESYDMGELKTDQNNMVRMGDFEAAWFKDTEGNILCVSNQ